MNRFVGKSSTGNPSEEMNANSSAANTASPLATPLLQRSLRDLAILAECLRSKGPSIDGRFPIAEFGFIVCSNTIRILNVPFFQPCLIVVLSGTKTIYEKGTPITCPAGSAFAVPGPATYDVINKPDSTTGRYQALVIPFDLFLLKQLTSIHGIAGTFSKAEASVLRYECDATLISSLTHYFTTEKKDGEGLLGHRLMEIFLILAYRDPRLFSFSSKGDSWTEKVRSVLSEDISHSWGLGEVCGRLATTESTLRRKLKQENSGFREIVHELRLGTALMNLLLTSEPVYRIAYDCGYQSVSRFSDNFRKRFGLPPTDFRRSMSEPG